MGYHRIKLRRDDQTTAVTCPYAVSGVCYRRGCIFIPHQHCLNKREFDKRMAKAKNMSSKKQKFVKRAKNGQYNVVYDGRPNGKTESLEKRYSDVHHYSINKIKNSSTYGFIIHERGFGKNHEH